MNIRSRFSKMFLMLLLIGALTVPPVIQAQSLPGCYPCTPGQSDQIDQWGILFDLGGINSFEYAVGLVQIYAGFTPYQLQRAYDIGFFDPYYETLDPEGDGN